MVNAKSKVNLGETSNPMERPRVSPARPDEVDVMVTAPVIVDNYVEDISLDIITDLWFEEIPVMEFVEVHHSGEYTSISSVNELDLFGYSWVSLVIVMIFVGGKIIKNKLVN